VNGVLGAVIGVPATMLVAGGLGIIGVTLYSRLVGTRRGKQPIRFAHLALGAVMFVLGVALVWIEVIAVGAS
jgi:hypothetical protein